MAEYTLNNQLCLRDEPPFCTAECPFQFDIRDFMEKLQRGRFDPAYKALRNAVGFPAIVCALCPGPCEGVCPRSEKDAAVSVRELERAALHYAKRKDPIDFNVPKKPHRIAIVGAGPSGLACALRLAAKKYDVAVWEATDRIGGHLYEELPEELFLEEFRLQFKYESYALYPNARVMDLESLRRDYDAVYVATGEGGERFGLTPLAEGGCATQTPGVFFGGRMLGKSTTEAIADGLNAVNPIERYLKTGIMEHEPSAHCTRMRLDPRAMIPMEPVLASQDGYSQEQAVAEAKRCLRCACDSCRRHCDLMGIYQKDSKRYMEEVDATVVPSSVDGTGTVAKKLVGTCNQCGLCADVCPEHIDACEYVLRGRQEMHDNGTLPWVFHEYWLRDMAFTNSQEAFLCQKPAKDRPAELLFFPGCQMGGSDPEYVLQSYRYLLERHPGCAIYTGCCGAPAAWAGDREGHDQVLGCIRKNWEDLGRPALVFGCPTCQKMFDRYLPELKGESLPELMAREGGFETETEHGTASVFDPCSSRHFPGQQQSVRTLAQMAGFALEPLAYEREYAQCCSFGGHVSIANPEYAAEVAKRRVAQSDAPYIVSCVNCRDVFAAAGKTTYHILDVLFHLGDGTRQPPTPTQRRENRRRLKARLLEEIFGEEAAPMKEIPIKVEIPAQLQQKLARELMLEEDVVALIAQAEATGRKLTDQNGLWIAHTMIGNMTLWVEYRGAEDGFVLENAYCHRMRIEED